MNKTKVIWIALVSLLSIAGTMTLHGCGTTVVPVAKFTIIGAGN